VPSTVELTAVVPAFSRDGDTPTSVHPAGHRLDCRPRGLQADGSWGPPATAAPSADGRAHQRSREPCSAICASVSRKIAGQSREAIEPGHHERVAIGKLTDHAA